MRILLAIIAVILIPAEALRAAEPNDAASLEFFEKRIRPVLAEQCFKCHSAQSEKIKGKLRVDTRAALLAGGESGPGVVPGNPEKSLLIEAVLYENTDLQMPPKNKLAAPVIQDLVNWVKAGAVWPEEKEIKAVTIEKRNDQGKLLKEHWAYLPIKTVEPPAVKDKTKVNGSLDQFIIAKLEQKNLLPAPAADKRTLLRRVTFDLIGLPPTPQEFEEFLKDDSANSYEKVIDRLMASPHFGERWGRHWLDVARYAETAGGGRLVNFASPWRYRDYVIDSFNSDKPYDQFIKEQIAGDILPAASLEKRRQQIIATGFLAVGQKNLDTQDKDLLRMDVVDEQLDTIGKSILGLTIGCARCHDHKFDPIPTRDYYSMAAIFRSTKTLTPGNVSGVAQTVLPLDEAMQKKIEVYEKELTARETRLHALRAENGLKKTSDKATQNQPDQPDAKKYSTRVDVAALPGIVLDNSEANIIGTWTKSTHLPTYVGEGYIHDKGKPKGELSVSFTPAFPKTGVYEVRLAYNAHTDRSPRVPVIIQHAEGEKTVFVNQTEPPTDGLFISLGRYRFNQGNDGSVTVSNTGTTGVVIVDAVQFIAIEDGAEPQPAVAGDKQPPQQQKDASEKARAEVELLNKLEKELNEFRKTAPAGPVATAVHDEEQVGDYNICLRGDCHRLGEPVQRGFLTLAAFPGPTVNPKQSGRLELAEWLVDRRNMLTPRVMVNRIWHHLFGAGIVRSTDNFGTTGEKPSNLELLDYLANDFVQNGWSVKKLIREIVLSKTYQQSVVVNQTAVQVDPENRLLWRANRRRLEVEAIRDAILMNSGQLEFYRPAVTEEETDANSKEKAKPKAKNSNSRTVYLPLKRESIEEMLEIFDFADTNLVVGARNTSNLPTQALYLMNSPFVMEQSRKAAERLISLKPDDAARIDLAYQQALGRLPTDNERKLSQKFLENANAKDSKETQKAWSLFYQSLMSCVEFRYLN